MRWIRWNGRVGWGEYPEQAWRDENEKNEKGKKGLEGGGGGGGGALGTTTRVRFG